MNLILISILIGNVTITSYRSVPRQTDASPWVTSTGERVHPYGVAVSRDLLSKYGGPLNYGDLLYIEGYGFKVINDAMHERKAKSIDIWVATLNEERKIGVRHGNVWLIKSKLMEDVWMKRTKRNGAIVVYVKVIHLMLVKMGLELVWNVT